MVLHRGCWQISCQAASARGRVSTVRKELLLKKRGRREEKRGERKERERERKRERE